MKKRTCLVLGLTSLLLSFSSCVEELDIKDESKNVLIDQSLSIPLQKKTYFINDFFSDSDVEKIETYPVLKAEVEKYLKEEKVIDAEYEIKDIINSSKDLDLDSKGVEKGVFVIKCINNIPASGYAYLRFIDDKGEVVEIADVKTAFEIKFPEIVSSDVRNPSVLDERIELNADQFAEMKNVDRIVYSFEIDGESILDQKEDINLKGNDFIELSLGTFIKLNKVIKKK